MTQFLNTEKKPALAQGKRHTQEHYAAKPLLPLKGKMHYQIASKTM